MKFLSLLQKSILCRILFVWYDMTVAMQTTGAKDQHDLQKYFLHQNLSDHHQTNIVGALSLDAVELDHDCTVENTSNASVSTEKLALSCSWRV
jgi:hypothetical protein